MICKSSEHPSHRCIKIRQLRDKKQPIPSNFCETHCGRITPLCSNKACAIVKLKNGRLLNLTCQKPNHGNKHFLLCDIETCRKNSEKYWKKLHERKEVVHFTPAEDLEDIDSEDIQIDVEDFDTKLTVSDEIDINLNCFPTLNIKNSDNDNTPSNHAFLKTYFELEKVKAKVPNSEKTTPVLILFDGGSGTTVGNHLEDLDEFETQQTRNIVLSSLNGVDRAQKRVCQITLIGENDKEIPLNVVIPSELIPKPSAQSMEEFRQDQSKRNKYVKWVDPITKDDIDNLPLILLGLNYRKHFPQPLPDKLFSRKFLRKHPDIVFSKSALTGKTMATGIESGLINSIQFGYHEYNEDNENPSHKIVKVNYSDSNESRTHQSENTDVLDLDEIEEMILKDQCDMPIIGNNEKIDSSVINEIIYNDLLDVDPGTLSLINTLQVQDLEVQNGQDEATLILVNKLEKERELEQRNYDLEKEKEAAKAVEKTKDNFPDLEKPKKSSQ